MENKKYETRKSLNNSPAETTSNTSLTVTSTATSTATTTASRSVSVPTASTSSDMAPPSSCDHIKSIQMPICEMRSHHEADNNNRILSRVLLQHHLQQRQHYEDNYDSQSRSDDAYATMPSCIANKLHYNAHLYQNLFESERNSSSDNIRISLMRSMSPPISHQQQSPSISNVQPFCLKSFFPSSCGAHTTATFSKCSTSSASSQQSSANQTSFNPSAAGQTNFPSASLSSLQNLKYFPTPIQMLPTLAPEPPSTHSYAATTSAINYSSSCSSSTTNADDKFDTSCVSAIIPSPTSTTTFHEYQQQQQQQSQKLLEQLSKQYRNQHQQHQHNTSFYRQQQPDAAPIHTQAGNKFSKDYHVVVIENSQNPTKSTTSIDENSKNTQNIEQKLFPSQRNDGNNIKNGKAKANEDSNGNSHDDDFHTDNNRGKNDECKNRNGKGIRQNLQYNIANESKSSKENKQQQQQQQQRQHAEILKNIVKDYAKYANAAAALMDPTVDTNASRKTNVKDDDDDDVVCVYDEKLNAEQKYATKSDNIQQQQQQTGCRCSLVAKISREEQSLYNQQQQQQNQQNLNREKQQQQQQQQQKILLHQYQNFYSREIGSKDMVKNNSAKENPIRKRGDSTESESKQMSGKQDNERESVDKIASSSSCSKQPKKLSKDEEKDELFQIFQPWALKTYGDQAKTKTITLKKKTRILKALDGKEHSKPDSSKFRFWVKSKGFTTRKPDNFVDTHQQCTQSKRIGLTDHIDLYVASTSKDFGERYYRKVAVVEEFFDIIYDVHVNLGGRSGRHAGQKRTYRIITETYAFLPREAVTKFLTTCPECKKNLRPYSPSTKAEDQATDVSVESTEALNYSSHTESSKDSANLELKKLKAEESEDCVMHHEQSRDAAYIPNTQIQASHNKSCKSPDLQKLESSMPNSSGFESYTDVEDSRRQQNPKSNVRLLYKNPITSTTTTSTETLAQKLKARKRSCESFEEPVKHKESYEPYCKMPKAFEFQSDFYKNQENLFNYFQLLKKFYYRPAQFWQAHQHDPLANLNPSSLFPSASLQNLPSSELSSFLNSMQQISNTENLLNMDPLSFSPSSLFYSSIPQSDHNPTDKQPNSQKSPNQSPHSSDLRTSPPFQSSQQERNNSKTKISPTSYSKQININIENAINLSTDSIDLTITPPNHHNHSSQTGGGNKDNTNLMVNSLDVSINVSNDSNQLKISCKTTPPSASPSTSPPTAGARTSQTSTPTSHFYDEKRFRTDKRNMYQPESVDISTPFVTASCSMGQMSSGPQQSQASDSLYYTTSVISPSCSADRMASAVKKHSMGSINATMAAASASSSSATQMLSPRSPTSIRSASPSPPPSVLMTSDRQTCAINLSKKFHETKRYCNDGSTPSGGGSAANSSSQNNLKDCKIKNNEKSKAHQNGNIRKNENDFIASPYDYHNYDKNENENALMMMNTIKNSSSSNNNNSGNNKSNMSRASSSSTSSSSSSSSSSSTSASSVVKVASTIKQEFSSLYGIDYKDMGMMMAAGNNNGSNSSSTDSTVIQVPISAIPTKTAPTTTSLSSSASSSSSTSPSSLSASAYYQQIVPSKLLPMASVSQLHKTTSDAIASGNSSDDKFCCPKPSERYEESKVCNRERENRNANDRRDNDDDVDNDNDDDICDETNKNVNKIDLMKVKPITSTYLTLTRSMGLSDEDALKFDDLCTHIYLEQIRIKHDECIR